MTKEGLDEGRWVVANLKTANSPIAPFLECALDTIEQEWAKQGEQRKIISNLQQQNTELLEDIAALRLARGILQKNLDDTFGNMLEAQEERDGLKASLNLNDMM